MLRADDGAGWRLGASLELPAVPQRLRPADEPGGLETIVPAQPAATVFHVFPGHPSGLSRHQLLVDFRWATRNLIEGVQARAGDRWPGTRSTK